MKERGLYKIASNIMLSLAILGSAPAVKVDKVEQTPLMSPFTKEWAPEGIKLKDHAVFFDQASDYYYLTSISIQDDHWEDRFAYARSTDLTSWEYLGPILTKRHQGWYDEFRIWAPHVIKEGDTYHMFYTGVTNQGGTLDDLRLSQTIIHATTTNPADPDSWQVDEDFVFKPNHKDMIYEGEGYWSDCRDPMVLKHNEKYYMYYTGKDKSGGIVGVATAVNLTGSWTDLGAMVTQANAMLESPGVIEFNGVFFVYYNDSSAGPQIRWGSSPTGPWSKSQLLGPNGAWAHEFFQTPEGSWITSFLTSYAITIDQVSPSNFNKPYPFIGEEHNVLLPFISNLQR